MTDTLRHAPYARTTTRRREGAQSVRSALDIYRTSHVGQERRGDPMNRYASPLRCELGVTAGAVDLAAAIVELYRLLELELGQPIDSPGSPGAVLRHVVADPLRQRSDTTGED